MNLLKSAALFCMVLLVFSLPTDGVVTIAGMSIVKITGLLSFGLVAVLVLAGSPLQGNAPFYLMILLYIAWVILSYLWTAMPVDYETTQAVSSQQAIKANIYALMMVVLMFQLIHSEHDLTWLAAAFVAGSGVLALLLLRNYDPSVTRNQIAIFDSNEVAVKLAMAIPLAAFVVEQWKVGLIRWGCLVYIPIAMLAIMTTGSRTGAVIMVISMLAFVPMFLRSSGWFKLASIIAALSLSVLVLNELPKATIDRMLSVGSEISEGTLNERSVIWGHAYKEWKESPTVGQGIGSFRRIVNRYNTSYTAHNSYIAIAVEQGAIGVALYISVILVALFFALQLGWVWGSMLVSLLFVVILGQMSLTLQDRMHIWFAYAFPVLLYHLKQYSLSQSKVYV